MISQIKILIIIKNNHLLFKESFHGKIKNCLLTASFLLIAIIYLLKRIKETYS